MIKQILAQKHGLFEMAGLDGVMRLQGVTPIEEGAQGALFVAVGIPRSSSFARANRNLARNFLLLAGVACGVTLLVGFYSRRFFFRPVQALASTAERLAREDLTARMPPMEGPAELLQLGRTLDEMAGRLQKRQEEIKAWGQELERRVAERTAQLEAANNELEAFNYSVSHDLRAPLRHMLGFAELLRKEEAQSFTEDGKKYLGLIEARARETGKLVDDLLGFSKTAREKMTVGRVRLNDLVEEARASLKNDFENRQVTWEIAALPEVRADEALLRMALVNLLSNALKYSRKRSPSRIEILAQSNDKEHIILVRDNGVGFDMQYASKLFGVFERLHDRSEFEGYGIGLANVRRIIMRHGGRVWAEGKQGEGAVFYFSLPKV